MNIEKTLSNHNYIQVGNKTSTHYGGDQSWWGKSNPTISHYGCGVIAMCDLELYLSGKYKTDFIDEDKYKEYICERKRDTYKISEISFIKKFGLFPWKMTRGIRTFLKKEMKIPAKVKWAPTRNRTKVYNMIKEMLDNDIPVVASYDCTLRGEKLIYKKDKNGVLEDYSYMESHYFVMTGIKENKIIQISTYGGKYFIEFDEWVKNLSYFTNILYIKRKE